MEPLELGFKLVLKGDANDCCKRSLRATIFIKLQDESNITSNDTTIIGNTVLYGATSGKLFAAGQAGEICGWNSGQQQL